MIEQTKQHIHSFKNAIDGFMWILATQRNFKIHLTLSFISILAGFILAISFEEFLVIMVLIGVGLSIEALNTAIEETIDAIHKEWNPAIKIAKDTSAAAMLIFSIIAFTVACVIFIPKIIRYLF